MRWGSGAKARGFMMTGMRNLLTMIVLVLAGVSWAQEPAFAVPEAGAVETVAEGFKFTEGPALAPDGSIWFTDIPNNAIHRFDPATGETTQTLADSGAANGLWFLADGRLVACAGADRRLAIYGVDDQQALQLDAVVRGHLNGPNDVAVSDSGAAAFFTDPDYRKVADPVAFEGVYRVDLLIATRSMPAQHRFEPIITDLQRPNGIGLSPDQRTLYVADNGAELLMAYPLDEQGQRDGEGVLFHDVSDLGGPDGMTVDAAGRVWQAIFGSRDKPGGVVVISPEGQRLGYFETGPRSSNVTFGADGRTLYITADGKLKRVTVGP